MHHEEILESILKSFNENKNSHAFLLVTNNIPKCESDVKKLIKKINCSKNQDDNCDCNICHTIQNGTNPDVITIYPDGKEIKKDQIMDIIDKFAIKPLINPYSVYTIVYADKMNDASANKLLKFLEEPVGAIVGFFITNNVQAIIPTIKSRCEQYNLNYDEETIYDLLEISEEEYDNYYKISRELVEYLNGMKIYELMSITKNYTKYERNEIEIILKLVRRMYIVKYENIMLNQHFNNAYSQEILNSIITDDIKIIVNRIKILDNIIDDSRFNVNKDLLFNKMFLLWN